MYVGRGWLTWLLLAAGALTSGCYTQNPSYFPHYIPPGRVTQTHAKPPGWSYFANFDPYACRIEVRPLDTSNSVGQQQVIIATVYDNSGQPRRGRRVEWMLEGVGHVVEVDESGYNHARGYKLDNRYGVSYTSDFEHTITRGNSNPDDDFVIRPGQTWCVVSSPIEGDSYVTAYAPGIHNWDKHKVTVQQHWINAGWTLPQPAVVRVGGQHVLTTNVYRHSDRAPVSGYRVRYTVLDGPPVMFVPSQQRFAEGVSNVNGDASATLMQTEPRAGVNRIGVEIIRPPDAATGAGLIIGRGETFVEWVAPGLSITKVGPPSAAVGQPFSYVITVTNTGRVEAEAVTIRDVPGMGMTFVNAQPPATREGQNLVWNLGPLEPGRSAAITAQFRPDQLGTLTNVANVTSADGIRAETAATTVVTAPGLAVSLLAPATGVVNQPLTYEINVTNTGSGPATGVLLTAEFDPALQHSTGENRLELPLDTLQAGQGRTTTLVLTARQAGQFLTRVTATADGNLRAVDEKTVTITQPRLSMRIAGPPYKYVRRPAEWTITIVNDGDVAASNVVLRNQLPGDLVFLSASDNGQNVGGGQIVWNLGTLQPREERRVTFSAQAEQVTPRTVTVATLTADPGLTERTEAAIEIRGAPGLAIKVLDTKDPLELGDATTYLVDVQNTGQLTADGISVVANLTPELQVVSGTGPRGGQPRIEGNALAFPIVDGLAPGQTFRFEIVARGVKVGDARCRIQLKSTALGPDPVLREESTNVFRPIENGPAAPPGP